MGNEGEKVEVTPSVVQGTGGVSKLKVFIAVPIYGGVNVHFFDALMKFIAAQKNLDYQMAFIYGDSLVTRARNTLTLDFLKSDCTHCLFLDSDLIFSLEQIERVLSHNEPIVGGFYPKKKEGEIEFVFNCLYPPAPMDERRLTPVNYMGTGFLCVKREVFQKMLDEVGDEIIFRVDGKERRFGFDFWPVGVYKYKDGTRRYLSEDWYFCQRAIDIGYTIYGDNAVLLRHSGTAVYPLKTQEVGLFKSSPKAVEAIPGWRRKEVEQYDIPYVFEPKTILDIGANIGVFTIHCKSKWPKAAITAIEPVPSNFEQLKKNCPDATLRNVAVRSFNGKDKISIGKQDVLCGFHDFGWHTDKQIEVQCVDAANLPSCEFVKIDTEGCEVEILQRLNLNNTLALVCEYHRLEDRAKLRSIAFEFGLEEAGWMAGGESSGVLKFVRMDKLSTISDRQSKSEAVGHAAAAPSPVLAAA